MRRFVSRRILRVCAKGWVAMSERGRVAVGKATSLDLSGVNFPRDVAARENALACPESFGGVDAGSASVSVRAV
jgi:hypothetical protein